MQGGRWDFRGKILNFAPIRRSYNWEKDLGAPTAAAGLRRRRRTTRTAATTTATRSAAPAPISAIIVVPSPYSSSSSVPPTVTHSYDDAELQTVPLGQSQKPSALGSATLSMATTTSKGTLAT